VEALHVVAGPRAWSQPRPATPVKELPEHKARSSRLGGWLLATGDWRSDFKQARVLKRIDLNGTPAFVVHAIPEKGRHRLIFLDARTGLSLGYDEVHEFEGLGMVGCEVRFADYRDIEGVQIPFRRTVKYASPRLGTWTFQVDKLEAHVKPASDPFVL
jgi:hypothetical protein